MPEPWAWTDWAYAGDQRWDDANGQFRTVYAAESAYGCFVEILAHFRPDPVLAEELTSINVEALDGARYASNLPGEIPPDWLEPRRLTRAEATGLFCDVTASETIAALRPPFLPLAAKLGLHDFDAASIKSAQPRTLTQHVASWLYRNEGQPGTLWDGVAFSSRHGDELHMWAIFERPGDHPISHLLTITGEKEIAQSDPDLMAAFELHRLRWSEQP